MRWLVGALVFALGVVVQAAPAPVQDDLVLVDQAGADVIFRVTNNDGVGIRNGIFLPFIPSLCEIDGGGVPVVGPPGVLDLAGPPDAGELRFVPDGGFNGESSVDYRTHAPGSGFPACSGGAEISPPATIFLVVNAPPVLDTTEIVINLEDGDLDIPLASLWSDADTGLANFPDDLDYSVNFSSNTAVFTASLIGGGTTLRIRPQGSGLAFANLSAEDNRSRDFPNDPGNGVFNFSTNSRVTDDLPIRVNTRPFVDTPIGAVTLEEDDPTEVIDLTRIFDDADAGDSLTYRVVSSSNASLADVSVVGTDLELTPEPDQNGFTDIVVEAEDENGLTVTDSFRLTVNPVNDDPFVDGGIADQGFDEDDPNRTIDISGAFDDVDIATNGDSLDLTIVGNTNTALFDSVAIGGTGTDLTIDLAADRFGSATITVQAEDTAGATVTTTFDIDIAAVDDAPTAADDVATIDEDTTLTAFDPLGNDSEKDTTGLAQTPGNLAIDSATVDVGSVVVVGGNRLTYTPPTNFFGTATINYVISDGLGTLTDDADVVVTVNQVDDAPVAVDDATTMQEDDTLSGFDPLGNDSEVDSTGAVLTGGAGASLTITAASADTGTVAIVAGGTRVDYTPDPDFFGTATIDYTISDGVGTNSDSARIVVTVTNRDDTPRPFDDVATIDEDTTLTGFDPRTNDFDDDSVAASPQSPGTLTITNVSVDVGSVVISGGGTTVDYTPPANFFGTATIEYRVIDAFGPNTDVADIVVTVNQVDDAPTAVDDATSIDEDTTLTAFDPRTNDSELDSTGTPQSPGSVRIVNASVDPAIGTVTVNGGNSIDFTPVANFFGLAPITYEIDDGVGPLTDSATINVTVNQRDDAPRPFDDAASIDEDTTLTGFDPRTNDFDDDAVSAVPQSPGNLVITSASADVGTATISGGGTTIDYTPPANFFGTATIEYRVIDGFGGNTEVADVVVTVNQVDDAPTAVDDAATIDEDSALTAFDPRGNDSEVDSTGTSQSPGSVRIVSASVDPAIGAVTVNAGVSIDFTPLPDYFGPAPITYEIDDGVGPLTDTATINVTVTQRDDTPRPFDDAVTIDEDTTLTGFDPRTNDFDDDAVPAVPQSPGNLSITAATADVGTVSITGGGTTLDFTPPANFFGTATIEYRVIDGFGGNTDVADVVVTVSQVDDAPTAVDDAATIDEDTSLTGFDPRGNDSELDSTGTVQSPGSVRVLSASVDPAQGTVTVSGGTALNFTPAANFFGTATISYVIDDGVGPLTDTADLVVTVNQVDDAPTAVDDAVTIDEDTTLTSFDPLPNDSEVDSTGLPVTPGALTIDAASVDVGSVSIVGGNALSYTPPANFFGTATINYVISDGVGALTDSADVVVTVTQVDDAPTAADDAVTIDEDTLLTGFDPRGNDSELDSTGTVQSPGSVRIVGVTVDPAQGVATISGGGTTIDFDSAPNFFGTATITYEIDDTVGPLTATADIVVTINNLDDPPNFLVETGETFGDDDVTTAEDTPVTFDVLANDVQFDGPAGEPITITQIGVSNAPANGSITFSGSLITYTPNPDFFGTDLFSYTVRDAFGTRTHPTFVTVDVTPVDDAPTAVDDAFATTEDTPVVGFDPIANDSELDSTGGLVTPGDLTITSATVSPSAAGAVTIQPGARLLDFAPEENFFGPATITYSVVDVFGTQSATADIAVTVTQVDDAPTAQDDATSIDEDTSLVGFDPLTNDTEVDSTGTAISPGGLVIVTASADIGAAAIGTGGLTVEYTPPDNFFGTATITYEVADGVGPATDSADIVVTVNPINDSPLAGDDVFTVDEDDDEVVLDVLANDFLFDAPVEITLAGVTQVIGGDPFPGSTETAPTTVIDITGDPITLPNGTVSIDGGAIVYEPKDNFNGSDFFRYTITDADGETSEGRVDITINSINDAPTAPAVQNFSVVQDTSLTVPAGSGLLVPAFDIDGDALTVILQTPPSNGVLTLSPDGSFEYEPALGFVGADAFEFFVNDGTVNNDDGLRVVQIDVEPAVVPPTPPPAGTVEDVLPLAQIPLELVEGVDPNVLVIMDDSGSMDFTVAINRTGSVVIRNSARIPRPTTRRSEVYDYLLELPNNTYRRGGLPAEREILSSSLFRDAPYGVWRGRHHSYNRIYYNPATRYRPWRGLAPDGDPFPDANPANARLNPTRDADGFINLLTPLTYRSRDIPEWDDNGGDEDRNNEDYFIPRYYRITDPGFDLETEPAFDTPHCLVEIRPFGEGYSARDVNDGVPVCENPSSGLFPGSSDRTDCANPLLCTYSEEIQNFANWFVYYRSREYTVKAALGAVVADITGLNIGYTVLNRTSTERRRIRPMEASFRGTNKSALLDQIYRIQSSGGTPLRRNLDRAGRHFRCVSGDTFGSSSDSLPGDADCPIAPEPAGLCQQQFALLFTDGFWNGGFGGIGNEDVDEAGSNFDGGFFADNRGDTLGDIAMFYYETDVQPTLGNLVPTTDRDRALAATDAFENAGNSVMHQHMTTFTVGFGVDGNLSDADIPTTLGPPATIDWGNPFNTSRAKVDDLRHAALNGRGDFLSAADPTALERELRAAFEEFGSGAGAASAVSFNSQQVRNDTRVFRGFYNTDDNTGDLVAQLIDFDNNVVIEPPVWSASDLLDARTPNSRVIVTYDRQPLAADPEPQGIPFRFASLNVEQRAAIDAIDVDYLRGVRTQERPAGDLRERPSLNGLLGDIVNSSPVFVGPPTFFGRDRIEYPVGTNDLYSDFADAQSGRLGMVYVGANDGMLHAFNSSDGSERWAYIPDRLIRTGQNDANSVDELTDPIYEHLFYVDGQPAINDVFITPRGSSNREWRTVLIGTFRAGGKGLFAVDVTDPSAVTDEASAAAQILWEFTDEDDSYPVVPTLPNSDTIGDPVGGAVDSQLDANGRPVRDLGFTFSVPTVAMTNVQGSGGTASAPQRKWAAVFGNGYNSTYGFATLFVNFIEDGNDGSWDEGDFVKIRTGFGPPLAGEPNEGLPNGLGEPRLIDLNGDGTVDFGYAGDLRGNMFRFDMTDPDPDNWTSTRIFRATYSDGTPQPITTQPIVTLNTQADGVVVLFGTGSYFTTEDGTSTDIQTLYGIWDRIAASPFAAEANPPTASGNRALLVEQEIINLFDPTLGALRSLTSNDVVYEVAGSRGWYIDFDPVRPVTDVNGGPSTDEAGNAPPLVQFPGERAVRNLDLRGGFLFANTVIPRDNLSCDVSPGGFGLALNPLTGGVGGANADTAFDVNNDGNFDTGDLVGGNVVSGLRFDDAVPTDSTFIGNKRFTQLSDRTLDIRDTNTGFGSRTGRLSWRELE